MIAAVIRWSLKNRLLVLLAAIGLAVWGLWAVQKAPLDALPDLSDTQVIIRVSYPGKAPQVVENLVTYPLTTTMLSVPGAKTVRGFRCLVIPMCMYFLTMAQTLTGRVHAFSNISAKCSQRYRLRLKPLLAPMPPASAGYMNMRSQIPPGNTVWPIFARYRIGR